MSNNFINKQQIILHTHKTQVLGLKTDITPLQHFKLFPELEVLRKNTSTSKSTSTPLRSWFLWALAQLSYLPKSKFLNTSPLLNTKV